MCFAGCIVGVLIAMAVKMPWQVQHLFWCVLDYGRIAATGESGRVEHYRKVGAKRCRKKVFQSSFKTDCSLFFFECRLW